MENTSPIFHPYLYLAKEIYAAMLGVTVPEDADELAIRETPFYQTTVTWWSCLELKYIKGYRYIAKAKIFFNVTNCTQQQPHIGRM